MTWYVKDKAAYVGAYKDIGQHYREIIGRYFPAMTAVEVADLVEPRAQVEIEVTAVVPTACGRLVAALYITDHGRACHRKSLKTLRNWAGGYNSESFAFRTPSP